MSTINKIAWLESQYLYPQHFQQQERYFEYTLEQRCSAIRPFIYGFSELTIDHTRLNEKRFALTQVKGIMPDGCPFDSLTNAHYPTPIDIPNHTKNQLIMSHYLLINQAINSSRQTPTHRNWAAIS